ncbi:MAG: UDP-N-acetylmuramoyl-L-alanyl-D-glutamate--2,6-diaminopimelate ligase [Alphaproteobacteria bacterium]|nr:UDP-N-acetylmuramoyl-L-alanyl-D-glutamate--2,6-diaminopimelate ligase [Alphaproteobacteria bacterium]
MPSLTELLCAIDEPLALSPSFSDIAISHVSADSRQVKAGGLFVALSGTQADGAQFIEKAVEAGAAAIVCDVKSIVLLPHTPVITVKNPRRALAQMAAAFYPAQPRHMVAVTGTDGKTSTADFFRQLMHGLGQRSASMGTLGVFDGAGNALYDGTHTTPDPVALHKMLAEIAPKVDYVCMEASSHGLHQHRLDGVKLEAAAFTNLARDHMDYHHTDEAYFAAKARLFDAVLPEEKTAVLNQDDARFEALLQMCARRRIKVIGFGKNGGQMKIEKLTPLPHGQHVELDILGQKTAFDIPLLGGFQVMNILAALGLVHGAGADVQKALALVPTLRGVPGRLELVATLKNGAAILIDYAHTPMALSSILSVLRPHTQNKLHVVFGCGGDRDTGKRPQMGKIASQLADVAIVTDDNPRSEDAALIRRAVMAECKNGREIAGRREAIFAAVKDLQADDVLVIAGKGHEKTQTIGSEILPFDDAEVVREAVA